MKRTKLRRKMLPGEKTIANDATDKEAKKIVEKILMFAGGEGIIA